MSFFKEESFDAIIVGGGIAGTSAAILLAEKGLKVKLFEKNKKPHHKVCGEFLSGESEYFLNKLGVDLNSLGAKPIESLRISCRDKLFKSKLPFVAKSLSRYKLDNALISRAIEVGVFVEQGALVKNFKFDESNKLFSLEHQDNYYRSKTLFWATGKSHVPKVLDRNCKLKGSASNNEYVGFKRHFRFKGERPSIEMKKIIDLIIFDGGYLGISEVESDLEGKVFNYCFIINKKKLTEVGSDWLDILTYQKKGNKFLIELNRQIEWLWERPLSVSKIPYGFIYKNREANSILQQTFVLGDQFSVIPSLTGDGMSMALFSSFDAVEAAELVLMQGVPLNKVVLMYNKKFHKKISKQVKAGMKVQAMFIRPSVARMSISFLRKLSFLGEKLVTKIVLKTRCRLIN